MSGQSPNTIIDDAQDFGRNRQSCDIRMLTRYVNRDYWGIRKNPLTSHKYESLFF
jgi:hypothetical protein